MIDKATADKIYNETVQNLYGLIQGHVIPGRLNKAGEQAEGSIKGFCDHYGIDRPNMMRVFNTNNAKDISVGLFQRCSFALGFMKQDECYDEAAIMNLSLRHFLRIDQGAVKDAIMKMHFA